jgi:thiol-disulfide isomerase/thioredoxin
MQGRGVILGAFIFLIVTTISMQTAAAQELGNLELSSPKSLPPLDFLNAQTKGKVVIANFWALWCAPCKIEKPMLDKLQADYAKKGLVVLTIADSGAEMEMIREYYASHQLTHLKPAKDTTGEIFGLLEISALPTTLIINKKGQEISRAMGPVDWNDKDVRRVLDKALAE